MLPNPKSGGILVTVEISQTVVITTRPHILAVHNRTSAIKSVKTFVGILKTSEFQIKVYEMSQ